LVRAVRATHQRIAKMVSRTRTNPTETVEVVAAVATLVKRAKTISTARHLQKAVPTFQSVNPTVVRLTVVLISPIATRAAATGVRRIFRPI
jgi:hypothetical protein